MLFAPMGPKFGPKSGSKIFPIFGHILALQFLLLIIQTTNYTYYWLYIQIVYLQLTRAFFIENYHTQDSESVVFNSSLPAPGFRRKAASNLKTFKGSRHMPHGPFQMTSGTMSLTTPKLKWNEEGLGSVYIASLNRAELLADIFNKSQIINPVW